MLPFAFAKLTGFFAVVCASAGDINGGQFFFLPPWWEYIPKVKPDALGQCAPDFTFPNDILPVALAILDMLLRVAGFVAVIAIILAGVNHLFSEGNPEKAAAARKRIYNSLIGLAIALIATLVVSFIGNSLGGG